MPVSKRKENFKLGLDIEDLLNINKPSMQNKDDIFSNVIDNNLKFFDSQLNKCVMANIPEDESISKPNKQFDLLINDDSIPGNEYFFLTDRIIPDNNNKFYCLNEADIFMAVNRNIFYKQFSSNLTANKILSKIEKIIDENLSCQKINLPVLTISALLSDLNFIYNCNKLDNILIQKCLLVKAKLLIYTINLIQGNYLMNFESI
jgi:hypothetical protein